MIHVAGLWELGWNTPIKEIELWDFMLRAFGVDEFHMTPITGISHRGITKEWATLQEILDHHRDLGFSIVFVDERGDIELQEFKHPDKALYVCGRANFSPLLGYATEEDKTVRVETLETRGLLWPHQALPVVLYDRRLK